MAPQDDLTAERAAIIGKHYECEDPWYSCPMSDEGCVNPAEGEECTCGVDTRRTLLDKLLKTARQEALREYREVIARNLQLDHVKRQTYSKTDIIIAIDDADFTLDRLASEGVK